MIMLKEILDWCNKVDKADVTAAKAIEDARVRVASLSDKIDEEDYYYIIDALTRAQEAVEEHEASEGCSIKLDSD